MDRLAFIASYIENSIAVKKEILANKNLVSEIERVVDLVVSAYRNGNKVMIAGNGGSAADAQHIAAEFVSRFFFDRPGLPAIALTTDTSMLTAIGNDYGFENLFSRQVQAQGREGDVFIGISTSGNSLNIVKAVDTARALGVVTVSLCGSKGILSSKTDHALAVPSSVTPYIQESHICIGHIICALVEEIIFGSPK